jgi:hypothetical protein
MLTIFVVFIAKNHIILIGFTRLNRQETTPALADGAREFAKGIAKIAKNNWRHRENLGVLRD